MIHRRPDHYRSKPYYEQAGKDSPHFNFVDRSIDHGLSYYVRSPTPASKSREIATDVAKGGIRSVFQAQQAASVVKK